MSLAPISFRAFAVALFSRIGIAPRTAQPGDLPDAGADLAGAVFPVPATFTKGHAGAGQFGEGSDHLWGLSNHDLFHEAVIAQQSPGDMHQASATLIHEARR